MQRFSMIRLALFAATFSAMLGHTLANEKPKQPNILWFVTEDMGPEQACYGHPEVYTPTIDQLAADGVLYTNAFTVTPVCSTSRSSFMTGMNACSIGAHQHRTPNSRKKMLPAGVRPLTGWLKDAGYYTANVRKINKQVSGTGKTDWNFKFNKDDGFAGNDWAQLKKKQPFMAQVNFKESHRNFTGSKRADPAKVKLPPYYPDHPAARQDWARYLDAVSNVDIKIKHILEQLKADGMADNTIVIVMGDHGRAHVRGKQWCYDSGLSVPLVIRWAKNFPVPTGFKPGESDNRLITATDVAATMLVTMAGGKKPAKMHGRVFLGNQREADRDHVFATRDRCDMTTFHIRTVRDKQFRYIRNGMTERPFLQWNQYKEAQYPMIKLMRKLHAEGKLNDVQKVLLADTRPKEELYDIVADPYEIKNLANDPKYAAKREELSGVLDKWIKQIGDQGPEPAEIIAGYDKHVENKTRPPREPKRKKPAK